MTLPAFETEGSGPCLLFLHAFPLTRRMWDAQARYFRPSHRVVRFDARGFGESPLDSNGSSMDRIADDAAALLDHLGVREAILVGCSMGSYAGFSFVRRYKERLAALVLTSSRAGADTPEARAARAKVAERVESEGASAAVEAFLPRLLGETTHRERRGVVQVVREMILAQSSEAIASALGALGDRADSTTTLAEIRVPTLVLYGAEDVISPAAQSEALHRGIAGSQLVALERAGHLPSLERPEAFNLSLSAFLGGLARGV